jgi:anti-sigma regulatory factor (Ser/Thr protein kinase)
LTRLVESFPAVPASAGRARHAITRLASAAGATQETLDRIGLAVGEALANVVVHAYDGEPGMIHVEAAMASGELWVLIADDGYGIRSHRDSPGLGQGLKLIAETTDELTIVERSGGGLEIRMRLDVASAPQARGSVASATRPASSRFSTTR